MYSHGEYWKSGGVVKRVAYLLHILLILLGAFMTVGGTYGVIVQIMDAYRDGEIDGVFSCADNSGST